MRRVGDVGRRCGGKRRRVVRAGARRWPSWPRSQVRRAAAPRRRRCPAATRPPPRPGHSVPGAPFGAGGRTRRRGCGLRRAARPGVGRGVPHRREPGDPSLVRRAYVDLLDRARSAEALTTGAAGYRLAADDARRRAGDQRRPAPKRRGGRASSASLGNGAAGGGAIEEAVSPVRPRFVLLRQPRRRSLHRRLQPAARPWRRGFRGPHLVVHDPGRHRPGRHWPYRRTAGGSYATSRARSRPWRARSLESAQGGPGTLTVIDLRPRRDRPGRLGRRHRRTRAGSPVRVITFRGRQSVARGSPRAGAIRLLGFSASRLRTDPAHSLVASVAGGRGPGGPRAGGRREADRGQPTPTGSARRARRRAWPWSASRRPGPGPGAVGNPQSGRIPARDRAGAVRPGRCWWATSRRTNSRPSTWPTCPDLPPTQRAATLRWMEIMTGSGAARVELDGPDRPAFWLALTHGAGGGVDSADLLAAAGAGVASAARGQGAAAVPSAGARGRPATPARQDAAWLEIIFALRRGSAASRWCRAAAATALGWPAARHAPRAPGRRGPGVPAAPARAPGTLARGRTP